MSELVTSTMIEMSSGIFIDLLDPKPEDINIQDIAWALSRMPRFGGHSISKIPYSVAQHTVMVSRYVEEALTHGTELNSVFRKYIEDTYEKLAAENSDIVAEQIQCNNWYRFTKHLERGIPKDEQTMHAFHGLMHDFAEAYLIDLPNPVKRLPGLWQGYKPHELRMDAFIYKTFGLPYSEDNDTEIWNFGKMVVTWADMHALRIEAWHFMPSRGLNWGIPIEIPTLSAIHAFRQPISSDQAYQELIERFEELQG